MNYEYDVAIVGGGAAGLAAALAAADQGAKTLILEKNAYLGGVLNQCIHNGFGLRYFKEDLTGPEYAARFIEQIEKKSVDIITQATVSNVSKDKILTVINPVKGEFQVKAKAVVLCAGCKEKLDDLEKSLGQSSLPQGIYTLMQAQRLINAEYKKLGQKAVIFGSDNLALILARQMTYEGALVQCVCEKEPCAKGLKSNIARCLDDYGIPLYVNTAITKLRGKDKLEGVYIAPLDGKKRPVAAQEKFVECDTLLFSSQFVPDSDLAVKLKLKMDRITLGPVVDETKQTSVEGIFATGSFLHIHDLADDVSFEAQTAGKYAALYAQGQYRADDKKIRVIAGGGIIYAVPQIINGGDKKAVVCFRTEQRHRNKRFNVFCGEDIIFAKRYPVLLPCRLEQAEINLKGIEGDLVLSLEESE